MGRIHIVFYIFEYFLILFFNKFYQRNATLHIKKYRHRYKRK